MRRNKYLDDLGIKIGDYGGNFVKEKKFQRFIERRKWMERPLKRKREYEL